MQNLGRFIVKRKILLVILFGILIIPAIIGSFFTNTNYDMLSYLPDDLNSVKGNKILSEQFGLSDTVYVLIYDKELWDVAKLKKDIIKLEGVKKIDWIDEFADVTIPVSFIPDKIKDQFISGKSTILQIQLSGNKESNENGIIIEKIKGMLDNNSYLGGQPVMTYELKKILDNEKIIYFVIGAVAIFVILSLSTSSLIEPLLLFVSLGVAILINMGTNAFLGSTSYMTSSIAAIIQLAVSVDYSIFLIHRYREEKQIYSLKEDAMISAISKTGVAVTASALTTIAGFASLLIMKIGIGKDLGFILAKGVILSLLTTVFLLPCLILLFDKLIERTRHKIIMPRFNLISRWAVKGKWVFLILIAVLLVPSFLAQRNLQYYTSLESSLPANSQSVVATEKIKNDFGNGEVVYVVTEDQDRLKENKLTDKIKTISGVDTVMGISSQVYSSIPDTFIPDQLTDRFKKSGYSYFAVQIKTGVEDKTTIEAINKINELATDVYGKNYYLTGESVLIKDMLDLSKIDMKYVNYLSIGLIALIIAISFRSLSIPVILVAVIQLAIWLNLSIPFITGKPVYFLTSIFIGAIQLGATVDYAILLTSRYKENLAFFKPAEAMQKTIKDTGQSIFTSALILFAGTLGITLVSKVQTTSELTNMIGRGALISMVIIYFGLPSLLIVFEKFIGWTTLGWRRKKNFLVKQPVLIIKENENENEYEKK
jgi:uncharacterized protein